MSVKVIRSCVVGTNSLPSNAEREALLLASKTSLRESCGSEDARVELTSARVVASDSVLDVEF